MKRYHHKQYVACQAALLRTLQQLRDHDDMWKREKEEKEGEKGEEGEKVSTVIQQNIRRFVDLQVIPEYENTLAALLPSDSMML